VATETFGPSALATPANAVTLARVAATPFVLVAKNVFWWLPVALISARELVISAYRSILGQRGISIPARSSAKVKTLVQSFAVGFALLPPVSRHPNVANTFLWVAVVLTLVSGVQYLWDGNRGRHAV
jgi:CDP-diacylglycerol--glycerol-3-phosphate 3-phosphatidyltransferase